ncbi:hypothetical protein M8C21_016673 [Ambrosia artemisiifolia]|uniref:Uncharacterized protein n=1 Tax=Ambrosia artemisiifolia TaxID=4212 RepID=A0AAD5CIU6_AMBAR|nr:hypothetical protein M8C21_016673 [Ambrosia artemisiifolia]
MLGPVLQSSFTIFVQKRTKFPVFTVSPVSTGKRTFTHHHFHLGKVLARSNFVFLHCLLWMLQAIGMPRRSIGWPTTYWVFHFAFSKLV